MLHLNLLMRARLFLCLASAHGLATSRRGALARSGAAIATLALRAPPALPRCADIESCREEGERREAAKEAALPPVVTLDQGVRYREMTRGDSAGGGAGLAPGDGADIAFAVFTTNGDYIYSLGRGIEPTNNDRGEALRITLGKHDVPVAIEMAMAGMQRGAVRRVEMPSQLGFDTSEWQPAPSSFSGRQRIERYRTVLRGNGLQPGYPAGLLFEVELLKARPAASKAGAL